RRGQDGSVDALIGLERQHKLDRPQTFVEFGRRIDGVGTQLRSLIGKLKADGKSIAGYGAATKATTRLAHFQIGGDELDFIVDDNPLKQGLFSPATHIPVLSPEELYRRRPDFVLILAWNFAEPIVAMHRRYAANGGSFIVPMPVPRIIER